MSFCVCKTNISSENGILNTIWYFEATQTKTKWGKAKWSLGLSSAHLKQKGALGCYSATGGWVCTSAVSGWVIAVLVFAAKWQASVWAQALAVTAEKQRPLSVMSTTPLSVWVKLTFTNGLGEQWARHESVTIPLPFFSFFFFLSCCFGASLKRKSQSPDRHEVQKKNGFWIPSFTWKVT